MAGTPVLERLTASDLFLLMWDDYGWSSDIGGLAICDGTGLLDPDGRVRIGAVRTLLEPRLHLVPRFRQLLYRPRLGLGWPLWVDAPCFDLADHIRVYQVAAPGGQAQLLQAYQELARRRLDPARPLWELWLLPGLPDRRVGAYLRLHHALADGPAALAAFAALLDPAPGAPIPVGPPWTPTPIPTAGELLADNLRRRRAELARGCSGLAHPGRTLARARAAWPAWREVLAEHPAPHTSLNHPVGAGRRLTLIRGRLDPIKQIAHAHQATVNDVVLAAVAGGLGQLLASRGEDVAGLVQRAMVTIARWVSPATSSPRLASRWRRPPVTAASITSLTVAWWAWAVCLVRSRRPRMRASRRPGPTGWLRLVRGAGCSVRTSRHAGRACRAWRSVLPGWARPEHPRLSSRRRRRRLSASSSPAAGIGAGAHGGAAGAVASAVRSSSAPKTASAAAPSATA